MLAPVLVFLACAPSGEPRADSASDSARNLIADSISRARQDSINRAQPGYVVDSILPIEEQLRRFRAGLPEVKALSGGLPTRESLVLAFARAVERHDTTALVRMAVNQTEYGWLVYPQSEHVRPPLQQAPQIAWYLMTNDSEQGLRRVLARHGWRPLCVRSHSCAARPLVAGPNTLWHGCVLRRRTESGAEVRQRLFGTLIERDGSWKVLSYANDY